MQHLNAASFSIKTEEITGGWRKLHNEAFIICTLNSKRMAWEEA
jgi:hypothetical protein